MFYVKAHSGFYTWFVYSLSIHGSYSLTLTGTDLARLSAAVAALLAHGICVIEMAIYIGCNVV